MSYSNFITQYLREPKTVGAIVPSSERLANKMIENINFSKAECIVEYGPGTGIFTEKIIQKKNCDTVFIIIECNKKFYEILKDKYGNESNTIIINGNAENIKEYLFKYNIKEVDYVVSGLPFTSLPSDISHRILANTRGVLKEQGEFITFQYTLFKIKLFKTYFSDVKRNKVLLNLPPANVLRFRH